MERNKEGPPSGLAQTQHGHAGVIIVEHRLLGCLPLEFPENRLGGLGRRLDQLPLRGRRQWDAEAGLQLLDACKGQPAAVAQQGQHTADALVVFLGSGLRWRRRGEELPAEIAAQLLQLVKARWKNRLSNDSQDGAGLGQTVELALGTIRTGIAGSQFGVGHFDFLSSGVIRRFISPADIKIVANATDREGTISQVEFFQGSNPLATTSLEIAPNRYSTLWTNVAPGTYQLTARATDDQDATAVSAPVNVTVIDCMPLSAGTPQFNPQTSLFEQKVRATNPTAFTLSAGQGLDPGSASKRPGVQRFGRCGGVPFVQYDEELGAGQTAELTIEYYVKDRQSFEAQLCAKPVLKSSPIEPQGTPVKIDRALWLADGTFMIEFSAVLPLGCPLSSPSDG